MWFEWIMFGVVLAQIGQLVVNYYQLILNEKQRQLNAGQSHINANHLFMGAVVVDLKMRLERLEAERRNNGPSPVLSNSDTM